MPAECSRTIIVYGHVCDRGRSHPRRLLDDGVLKMPDIQLNPMTTLPDALSWYLVLPVAMLQLLAATGPGSPVHIPNTVDPPTDANGSDRAWPQVARLQTPTPPYPMSMNE